MSTFELFIVIVVAGLVHASFQLSVSMLTLLSSHTIGRRRSHARLLSLATSFGLGVTTMTLLVLSFFGGLAGLLERSMSDMLLVWAAWCGLAVGVGIAVWLFYYRREPGTMLWIPRSLALFLSRRAKKTKHSAEAFSLGLTSVLGEVLLIAAPLTVACLAIVNLPGEFQLVGVATYLVVSITSLIAVTLLVGAGHSISKIQKWREANKHFLQFSAGSMLIALAAYVYVQEVVTETVMAAARAI